MKETDELLNSNNVLPLRAQTEVPHEIAHPASKWYPDYSDDPLADILFEFEQEDELAANTQPMADEIEDFIYAHNLNEDNQIKLSDTLPQMITKLTRQVKRLKEDTKRIKYYMDEVEDHLID